MEADDEFILLAEDRSELPTHMPDNVQSLPTGGLWRRRSKARVKERQKIVIVGWSITSVPRSWSWTSTVVQVRRCGFTRRCPRTTERSFSKETCAVDRRSCRILQSITGKGLWELAFAGRSAHQNVEQNSDSLRHPCVKSRRCGTTLCPGWLRYQRCTRRELGQ